MHASSTLPQPAKFDEALGRFQSRWRLGLLLLGLLRALWWGGLLLLLFSGVDFLAGFSDLGRRIANSLLWTVALGGLLLEGLSLLLFRKRQAAIAAGRATNDSRREILSALELQHSTQNESPLTTWLRHRALLDGEARLQGLSWRHSLPRGELNSLMMRVAGLAALFVLLWFVAANPMTRVTSRLLFPKADLPPWSPLTFQLSPNPASVLYGSDLLVSVEVGGGKLREPVVCITREPTTGNEESSRAFEESPTRFSQRLERMTTPLEIAFASGRARSEWLPVRVVMQPKILSARVSLLPPAYTGKAESSFSLGAQPLQPMRGSRIELTLESNRPLRGGRLTLTPATAAKQPREIAAESVGLNTIRFTWNATAAGQIAAFAEDTAGTASDPVLAELKIRPDGRPEVAIEEPAGEVFATPDSSLPFRAIASDDFGLQRVSLIRRLVGYRERSREEAVSPGEKRWSQEGKFALREFGLVPGQTIELSLEATDTNPSLLGVSLSEPSRIRIISREQYAQMLRDEVTLEDFTGRYQALQEGFTEAKESLDALEKALNAGDAKVIEAARKAAQEAHRKALEMAEAIANDFPIFDLDPGLSLAAQAAAEALSHNEGMLEWKQDAPADLAKEIAEMKSRLGEGEKAAQSSLDLGERASKAAAVMEQSGRFKELLQSQKNLVKNIERVAEQVRRGEMRGSGALEELGEEQRQLAEEMKSMEQAFEKALGELGDEFSQLKQGGQEFLQALRELEVPELMKSAATAAEQADSRVADEKARAALAAMESLLRANNCISGMCRGEKPSFPWPGDLSSTLEQLMRSLIAGRGGEAEGETGTGEGSAMGDSGYWARGQARRSPVYGPPRIKFSGGRIESTSGRAGKGGAPTTETDSSTISTTESETSAGTAAPSEVVPEVYREAVRRYFSDESK